MLLPDAVALINTEFKTRKCAPHYHAVYVDLTYDGCSLFSISIYDYGDKVSVLTDVGSTKDFFDQFTEDEWVKLCAEHGFEFNNWRIERVFNSLNDLYEYIDFIDYLCNTYEIVYSGW